MTWTPTVSVIFGLKIDNHAVKKQMPGCSHAITSNYCPECGAPKIKEWEEYFYNEDEFKPFIKNTDPEIIYTVLHHQNLKEYTFFCGYRLIKIECQYSYFADLIEEIGKRDLYLDLKLAKIGEKYGLKPALYIVNEAS